jgi:hypothetical protein
MLRRDGSGLPWSGKGEMLTQVGRISKKTILAASLRPELTFTSLGRHGGATEANTSGRTETQLMTKGHRRDRSGQGRSDGLAGRSINRFALDHNRSPGNDATRHQFECAFARVRPISRHESLQHRSNANLAQLYRRRRASARRHRSVDHGKPQPAILR